MPGDWRRPGHQETYEIVWGSLGSPGRLHPYPAPNDISAAYDVDDYYTHGKVVQGPAGKEKFLWRVLMRIAWSFDRGIEPDSVWWRSTLPPPPAKVIDLGCGNGALIRLLQEHGYSACGVDPDPNAIEFGARCGVEIFQGTAEALPSTLGPGEFDVAIMSHSLEHCHDPQRALANAFDLLRPGGMFVVEVPNNSAAGFVEFGPLWHWLDVPRHLTFFDRKSLETAISDAGFEVTRTVYRGYCRQFSRSWFQAQETIADRLNRGRGNEVWRYVRLLLRTIVAPDSQKYDSVRVIAQRPSGR